MVLSLYKPDNIIFSKQLGIDQILLTDMNFEEYESDMFNIRKKIKKKSG